MYMKSAILVRKDSQERIPFEKSLNEIKEYNYFKPNLSLEINENQIYFFKINLVKFEDFKKSPEFTAIFNFLENLRKDSYADHWTSDPNGFLKSKSFTAVDSFDGNIQTNGYSNFLIIQKQAEQFNYFNEKEENLKNNKNNYKEINNNSNEKNNDKNYFNNSGDLKEYNKNSSNEININEKNDSNYLNSQHKNNQNKKINAYYCGILKNELEKYVEDLFFCKLIKTGHSNQLTVSGLDFIFNNIQKSFFYLPGQKISNLVKVGKLDEVTEKTYTNIHEDFYPFVMANILEGTSVYKVESKEKFVRIGGTNFGASSYWSLVSMICGYDDPEKAVEDAIKGNNELIDLSISDIYGGGYDTFNLDSSLIASSFGKIKHITDMSEIDKKDISRSLMTLMCVTASQVCAFLAKQENIKNILIVGNSFESLEFMQMVQMCVGYYSEDRCKAYFSQYSPFINLIGMIKLLGL
jgi:pantothenate kinase